MAQPTDPTFPVLHRQTFLNNYRSLPHLLFSVCLLSTGFSSDPFVLANRSGIEVSLFLRCARELRACIDRLPEYHLDETTLADASDTGCPETCLALAFVALWAYRRGYASLHQSVIQLALRLARRYGLAVDPGESSTFGMRTPRDAWVRRELRRKAWASIWTLSEFVKSITGKEIDDLAAEGRRHRIPPNDHQWEIDSEDPGWIPPLFEAPGEFRPRIMELVDWMDKPATDPLRQPGIEFSVGALERRSLVVIYLFGFLRLRTNQFLDSCKAVGISPVELQGLEAADEEEEGGEIEFSPKLGLESPQPSQVFETLPPETKIKVLRGLKRKADRIEGNIKDILANLPPRLRKAEAEGDAAAMIDFFQPEVASVPFADKSLFARVLYLSQIRLFKLEARTSYGVLGFQDMGKLAAEWHMGTLFQDCLESAIVYTRCLASLVGFLLRGIGRAAAVVYVVTRLLARTHSSGSTLRSPTFPLPPVSFLSKSAPSISPSSNSIANTRNRHPPWKQPSLPTSSATSTPASNSSKSSPPITARPNGGPAASSIPCGKWQTRCSGRKSKTARRGSCRYLAAPGRRCSRCIGRTVDRRRWK